MNYNTFHKIGRYGVKIVTNLNNMIDANSNYWGKDFTTVIIEEGTEFTSTEYLTERANYIYYNPDGTGTTGAQKVNTSNYLTTKPMTCMNYFDYTCYGCDPLCKTCSDYLPNACLSCEGDRYYLALTNTCIYSCPNNTVQDAATNVCIPCFDGCSICTTPSEFDCQRCSVGYFYDYRS